MTSLRSRLILAFALVAVVPLVTAMALLGRSVQREVDAQAMDGLDAALGSLESQLRADGERLAARLDGVAGDARLARLVLERGPGDADLADHLASQRRLLGLDYLGIRTSDGGTMADAADAAGSPGRTDRGTIALESVARSGGTGATIVRAGSGLALDARSPLPARLAGAAVVQGGIALDSTRLEQMERTSGVDLVLTEPGGAVVASTIVGGEEVVSRGASGRVSFDGRSYILGRIPIALGPGPHATLAGFASTADADRTIAGLWGATLVIAALAVALAVALGILWSRQVSHPVERLAAFSDRIARGEWEEPLAQDGVRELRTLIGALERMRGELRATRDRLLAGERQAAYGRMARLVAHEIKNPLTPIAVSIADLRRSYELERADFPEALDQAVRIVGEEVASLKRLIQEFTDFGRFPSPEIARFDLTGLLAELETLHAGENRLRIEPASGPLPIDGDRGQLRQALLNLIRNGLEATGSTGRVTVAARAAGGAIEVTVADDGPGLPPGHEEHLFVPGFTTKPGGSGLGLAIVERIVNDHRGTVAAESAAGRGTTFRIRLPAERGA